MSGTTTVLKEAPSCKFKNKCLRPKDKELVKCAQADCNKHFHTCCSEANKRSDGSVFWACTKTHYTALQNSKSSSRVPWDKDGADGPRDPPNSERILLDWLLTANNYYKYKGGTGNRGTSALDMCYFCRNSSALSHCCTSPLAIAFMSSSKIYFDDMRYLDR
ncbi:unnamed protein product [Cylindrotheca closterium]|uniref:Uncharacterized protein n=1 Tax=Cylindrotheca closterium TaxID=2856 RepID=A0AAD2JPZ6_9STRA|nr:unnamed protein product [Cylindrotheca closterium]